MNSCNYFQKMLDAYLEGSLTAKEETFMKKHDASCKNCHEELLFRQAVYDTLHTLPKLSVSPDFTAKLNARLDAIDEGTPLQDRNTVIVSHKFRFAYQWKKYSAVAACLLLAVLVRIDTGDIIRKANDTPNIIDDYTVSDSVLGQNPKSPVSSDTPSAPSPSAATSQADTENTAIASKAPSTAANDQSTAKSTQKPATNKSTPVSSSNPAHSSAPAKSPTASAKPSAIPAANSHEQDDITLHQQNAQQKTDPVPELPNKPAETSKPGADTNIMTASSDSGFPVSSGPSSSPFSIPVDGSNDDSSNQANNHNTPATRNIGNTVSKSGEFTLVDEIEGHTVAGVNMSSAMNSFIIVDSQNETQVKDILSKYLAAADSSGNPDYFLTPTGYQAFIDDLKENDIDFKSTFDFPGNSPVLVKLIVT